MYNSAGSRVKCFFHSCVGADVWLVLCYAWVCGFYVSYLEEKFKKIHLITMGKDTGCTEEPGSITSVILI